MCTVMYACVQVRMNILMYTCAFAHVYILIYAFKCVICVIACTYRIFEWITWFVGMGYATQLNGSCHTHEWDTSTNEARVMSYKWINIASSNGNVLHQTATDCNRLQQTATGCCNLQHAHPTCCNTLQHSATHCNTLQHTATHCETRYYVTHHLQWQEKEATPTWFQPKSTTKAHSKTPHIRSIHPGSALRENKCMQIHMYI